MIHEVKGCFAISSHECWLPGAYDTRRAANYAFHFPDVILQKLQDSVNPDGIITFEMLQDAAKQIKAAAAAPVQEG